MIDLRVHIAIEWLRAWDLGSVNVHCIAFELETWRVLAGGMCGHEVLVLLDVAAAVAGNESVSWGAEGK